MSQFAPCPTCNRHARTTDAECPFCGAALRGQARQVTLPTGAKRAVLFAIGLSAASTACGARADGSDMNSSPVAPTDDVADDSGAPPTDSTSTGPAPTTPPSGGDVGVPVYGAPVSPETPATPMLPTATPTPGPGPGPLPVPVYGAPVFPEPDPTAVPTTQPDAGAGGGAALDGGPLTADAGVDGGVVDAGADEAMGGSGSGGMPNVGPVPPYGAPPQPVYGAPIATE
jgi:hypothetical protein